MNTIIWDLKMLTFIDGEPLKAGLVLRGPTGFGLACMGWNLTMAASTAASVA